MEDGVRKGHLAAEEELINMGEQLRDMGRRMLKDLWFIYRNTTYQTIAECSTLPEYVTTMLSPHYEDPTYLEQMGLVTDRIFSFCLYKAAMNEPITREDGVEVTPEYLIDYPRIIGKLVRASQIILTLETDEEKVQLILDVLSKKTKDQLGETVTITIPCWEEVTGDGDTILVMPLLNEQQVSFVKAALGEALDINLGRWEDGFQRR